jgi:hypothetical protein
MLAVHAAEDEGIGSQFAPTFQDCRQPSLRVERNSAILPVLGGSTWNTDLAGVPVDALVLDQQHFAAPAAQLQRADDSVVQELADVAVQCGVHDPKRRIEQAFLLLA